jgi:putative ABC transport system permease protein
MNDPEQISPPKWADRLLRWYCRPNLLEDLQGDLNEYFDRNVKTKGARRARMIYIIDVFKFFRLYTVRKPEFVNLLINWIMIRSYIKTSGRSMVRNKLFTAINIVGLAISMSVGLLLIGLISDVLSYDKFHKKHSTIYRVISKYQYLENKDDNFMATTSVKAAKAIEETFSQPEGVAILKRDFGGDIKVGEKVIPLSGLWANESMFDVFSFELLKGNAATALKNPFSVILTEESAKKLFGDEEAMDKTIVLNNDKAYTVTGILKDVPVFSHIKFDMLGSFSTREVIEKDSKDEMKWDNIWSTWVYIVLPDGSDLKEFKASLDQLSVREDPSVKNTHIELALQPMDDIMLGEDLNNQIGTTLGSTVLWSFSGLTFVVILSACFNYTNLSIARSLKRTREVGIRKVIGALKSNVVAQFVVEAVIISLCSLVLAFVLFLILKPYFLNVQKDIKEVLVLDLSPQIIVYFIVFAIVIGIGAGLFPALFFSRINAIQVLKDISSVRMFKKLTLRKVLIVFQYTISIIFITSTIVIYKQYKHFIAFDLGFNTENVLNIKLQGNKAEILKKELFELPEVKEISQSIIVTSVGNYWGTTMKYPANPDDSAGVYYNTVDEKYLELHDHKLLAGRNFNPKADSAMETEVIVNEQVLKRFNIADQNPAKALGEVVRVDGKDLHIIGVLKDFHYGKADNRIDHNEVVFRYSSTDTNWLNVKIQSADLLSTYTKIESIWKRHDGVHPLEAKFYSDQLEQSFAGMKAMAEVAGFLAFLIICIASMGLLGMVVFTTETRLKEISIRKVLGASEIRLLYLLGKSFLFLLGISILIALPITILFFEQVAFPEINNHAPLSLFDMLIGVLAVLLLALMMIGSQTLKVARANPAEVLKNE